MNKKNPSNCVLMILNEKKGSIIEFITEKESQRTWK